MPPTKKSKTTKDGGKSQQITLFKANPNIARISVVEQYLRTEVLLTESIYHGRVPDDAKGKYFKYIVSEHEERTDTYSVKYCGQAISPSMSNFVAFHESDESVISGLSLKEIKSGRSLYMSQINKTKAAENDKVSKMKKELQEAAKDPTKVDLSDIDTIIDSDPDGGKSFSLINLEFEPCDHADNDENKKQRWRHKSTGRTFWVNRNANGTAWETGCWNRELLVIASGKLEATGRFDAQVRAQRLLKVRGYKPREKTVLKGMGKFFPFEEDLPHHINEALVVISTGSPISFFANPFVIEWLQKIEPRHRPLYRVKFLRLLRVIQFVLNLEISLMLKEAYLRYGGQIVASTSDFWWDNVRKASFGACIGNFMAKQYRLRNGIDTFMSDVTLSSLSNSSNPRGWETVLRSIKATIARCQALFDVVLFDKAHTGEEVGAWLYDIHERVGCEPYMQGSQVVDGDATAGASIGELSWKSSDERSEVVVADKCDAHQANTSGRRASGTSVHRTNRNPPMGESLKKLHLTLGRVSNSGKRMGIYKDVGKERKRTKTLILDSSCETRWSSHHDEVLRTNMNQADLATALDRLISKDGYDKELWKQHQQDISKVKPTESDYLIYQQYECALGPLRQFLQFSQGAKVVVHLELFEARMAIERMSASFFFTYENLSTSQEHRSHDLTKRRQNQF
eukprot:scaffold78248_cov106-Cyclotella_meneghiniana.AAC.1